MRSTKKVWVAAGLAVAMLAMTGCGLFGSVKEKVAGKTDIHTELVKAFGNVDQSTQAGQGYVVLAPQRNGSRDIGYVARSGGQWALVGRRFAVPDEKGKLALKQDGDMVVLQTDKDGAPQYSAYKYSSAGLEAADYYTKIAPQPGVRAGHFLLVNKRLNVLWHYQDGNLVKAYRVATGRQTEGTAATWSDYKTNFYTPEGAYTVSNFVTNPTFNALKAGDQSYAGGAPGNPLGTRWMGFTVLQNDNAWIWGIHGTSHPELIGTWASDGCIRMYTQEVEQLFAQIKGKRPSLQIVKA